MNPQKRLQVLNQSNPSLRVAAAPAPQIKVNQTPQAPLRVSTPYVKPQAQPKSPGFLDDVTRPFQQFGNMVVAGGKGVNALIDVAQKQKTAAQANADLDKYLRGPGTFGAGLPGGFTSGEQASKSFFDDPKKVASMVGTGAQIGSYVVPGSIGFKAATTTLPKIGGSVIAGGIGSGIGSLGEQIANEGKIDAKKTATATAAGGVGGGALFGLGRFAGKFINKLKGNKATKFATNLASVTDPEEVSRITGLDSELSQFIANQDNPELIKSILETGADTATDSTMKVYTALHPDPTQLPEGYMVDGVPTGPSRAEQADEYLRSTDVRPNAVDTTKNPANANAVFRGASKETTDPLNTVINSLAKSPNKGEVRRLIEGVLPELSGNEKNRLVRDLTKETDPDKIFERIADEHVAIINGKTDAPKPVAPETTVQQAAQDVSTTQNGTTIASEANAAPTAPTSATDNIGETVAQTADENVADIPNSAASKNPLVAKVTEKLKEAEVAGKQADKEFSKERASAFGQGAAANEELGGGLTGYKAKLAALKGKKKSSTFQPIEADGKEIDEMLNLAEKAGLKYGETLNLQTGILKLYGQMDGAPTPSEIKKMREVFGDDFADSVQVKADEVEKTIGDKISQVAGIPRAAMSTFDLSMGGRQGLPVAVKNASEWANANKESVQYMASNERFQKAMQNIQDDPDYTEMSEKMHIRFPGIEDKAKDEFVSSELVEKVPYYGTHAVAGSSRAYNGGLTKLRYNLAKSWKEKLGEEKWSQLSEQELKDIGEVINTFTGSGGKKGGALDQHMTTLSNVLFSPRLWGANINRLNPYFYYRLSPVARKEALKYQSSYYALVGSVLAAAAMVPGVDVVWDPRSADFAKIKVGNTRYDIMGGQQQNLRLIAQLATGQKIDSTTGELKDLGDGFTNTRKGVLTTAFEGKLNPLLGFAAKMADLDADGNNKYGEHVNPLVEASKLLIPLNIQGVADTFNDTGNIGKSVAMNLPSVVGFGTQTYGTVKTKDQGKPTATGKPTFKGKITPDMVTDSSGQVILDAKGKPVKVKIPEGATELEIQALKDDKRKSALTTQYNSKLSTEDQALLKLSGDKLKEYVDSGKISEEKYNDLQQKQQDVENLGGVKVPDGVKSKPAQDFYRKYNSLTKANQEKWLKEAPDETAKTIAEALNKQRTKGLSPLKPSNELTKAYAEYEKDINSHPEYTAVDKRNKAQAFQKFTTALNYSENSRDLYSEGGSSDLRYLIDNGDVDKKELAQAIALDNELYKSGVTGTLKFSKKFRNDFGYATPTSGGNGSGGGGSTTSVGLSKLLPKFNTGSPTPQVSSTPRKITFKSSVKTDGGSTAPKVNIKL